MLLICCFRIHVKTNSPTVWNSLPDNVVNSDTLATYKKQLKTNLFRCVLWNILAT